MKSLWQLTLGLLILHAVAAAGVLAWLGATQRLNADRVRDVVDVFRHTVAEQAKLDEQAAAEAKQDAAEQRNLARLQRAGEGPITVSDRLEADRNAEEMSLQRVQWLARAADNLTSRLARDRAMIAEEKAKLDAEREKLEASAGQQGEQQVDEDFQLAVQMVEQLKPAAAKVVFEQMIEQGRTDEVIDYLAAMQLRKAGAVLREFKTPRELQTAKDLIERLRQRGVETETAGSETQQTGSA